jgi:glycerol-3-phosphate dehydrogenase subunit B
MGFVRRADGHNHVVATALGTVKRAALVPASQHLDVAELATHSDVVLGVVDWLDLAGFGAAPAAALLGHLAGTGPDASVPTIQVVQVPRTGGGVFRDAREMARALDDDEMRGRALAALRGALRALPVAPTHLLTPAVLGTRPLDVATLRAIDDAVGMPLRELVATPPSVPAVRLQTALRRQAEVDGVEVVDGTAADPVLRDGLLRSLTIHRARGIEVVNPAAVIIASGRFFAGGLVRDHVAREALFGLPIVADGRVVGDAFIGDLTADHVDGDHAIFSAGLAIDGASRPLDASSRPFADNVFAAGHIIGGYDPARDGGALAVAAWTARQAALQAVR